MFFSASQQICVALPRMKGLLATAPQVMLLQNTLEPMRMFLLAGVKPLFASKNTLSAEDGTMLGIAPPLLSSRQWFRSLQLPPPPTQ
ncbi:hypothetical protein [Paraflavitalea speifideaquila]|uniref:hypothetical protein n=1 Tax=Paraflavitalea speifideaquila TaxID=3076558 RepID=UPI0028E3479B|nr:hypothetical protein [Paraflavitalea speifideiaquila]